MRHRITAKRGWLHHPQMCPLKVRWKRHVDLDEDDRELYVKLKKKQDRKTDREESTQLDCYWDVNADLQRMKKEYGKEGREVDA